MSRLVCNPAVVSVQVRVQGYMWGQTVTGGHNTHLVIRRISIIVVPVLFLQTYTPQTLTDWPKVSLSKCSQLASSGLCTFKSANDNPTPLSSESKTEPSVDNFYMISIVLFVCSLL